MILNAYKLVHETKIFLNLSCDDLLILRYYSKKSHKSFKKMDTLEGMPFAATPERSAASNNPERVEPLAALQNEFSAITSALTNDPTPGGLELSRAHLFSLAQNLKTALSMFPANGSGKITVPNLEIDGKYIDPPIAELFRIRCREVIDNKRDKDKETEIRFTLISLQEKVNEATIEVLDAMGIIQELDEYREMLVNAIGNRNEWDGSRIIEVVRNCRRFLERVKSCKILPKEFQVGVTLFEVQLNQFEDEIGLLF